MPTPYVSNPSTLATGRVQASSTATLVVSSGIKGGLVVKADDDGGEAIYVGMTSSVTTTTGFKINPGQSLPLGDYAGNLYVITASGTVYVYYAFTE
jgi:hypothetical protein